MLAYFYGKDTYGARREISNIAEKAGAAIRWLDREELEEQPLRQWLENSGGLFGVDLVVVRDPSAMPKSLQEDIVTIIKEEDQSRPWILWDRVKPDKRSVLFKALKKTGREFAELAPADVVQWLQSEVSIDRDAAHELVARVGNDRWRLLHEAQRLALTCDPVTLTDIRELVPEATVQEDMFVVLDSLSEGNGRVAIQKIEHMLTAGENELYILSMLAYQFKTLLAVKAEKTAGLHSFVIQKNQTAAQRLPQAFLQNALARILATDFSIKQGVVDARTGLLMLVLSQLSQLSAQARSTNS